VAAGVSCPLRRLKRKRDDLYERVTAGEMTANAVMIEAIEIKMTA
jgi:hypothetical protein